MDTKDVIKIIAFIVFVPLVYFIKKNDKSENSRDTSNRGTNFYTGMVVQLYIVT